MVCYVLDSLNDQTKLLEKNDIYPLSMHSRFIRFSKVLIGKGYIKWKQPLYLRSKMNWTRRILRNLKRYCRFLVILNFQSFLPIGFGRTQIASDVYMQSDNRAQSASKSGPWRKVSWAAS